MYVYPKVRVTHYIYHLQFQNTVSSLDGSQPPMDWDTLVAAHDGMGFIFYT